MPANNVQGIQTAPPGTPEATPSGQEKLEMPVYHNNVGPLGIRPQDVSSLDAAQKVKLAEEILALDEKAITPKEQDRRDAETKLKKDKEAEESEKARVKKDEDEAEIDKLTEKSWEWMRDHAVELREEDFLIALSSRAEHLDVIRASRKWRQVGTQYIICVAKQDCTCIRQKESWRAALPQAAASRSTRAEVGLWP